MVPIEYKILLVTKFETDMKMYILMKQWKVNAFILVAERNRLVNLQNMPF